MPRLALVSYCAIFCGLLCALNAQQAPRGTTEQQYWNNLGEQELETNKKRFASVDPNAKAKNIIIFVGDGMGVPTLTAARVLKAQRDKQVPGHPRLHFEEFPYVGLAQTYNTNYLGPDSAGTATAYLCGVKTDMGVIGVDERVNYSNCNSYKINPDSKLKCIAEQASEAGKSVGLISTKTVTDASPSPVYAHSPDREWMSDQELPAEAVEHGCVDIATQLVDNADFVNVALGGGSSYFSSSYRRDKRDLSGDWLTKKKNAGKNAALVSSRTALQQVDVNNITDLLGLFAPGNMHWDNERLEGGVDEPSLAEMTTAAIKILRKNPKGYFLFVEGGKIDSAHHKNLAGHALFETLALENAVIEAMKIVDTSDTIVVVTADHSHVFSYGSYTSQNNYILDPTDSSADERGMPYTSMLYGNGPGFAVMSNGSRPYLTAEITNSLNYAFEAAVPLDEETHGCDEVAVYAIGPQAHLMSSLVEQNTVAHLMMYSACIGQYNTSSHCFPTVSSAGFSSSPFGLLLVNTLIAAFAVAISGRFA